MENPTIDQQYLRVCHVILKGLYNNAFKRLHNMSKGSTDKQLIGRIDSIEAGYKAALQCLLGGTRQDDSHYTDMQRDMLRLASSVAYDCKLRAGMNIFTMSHLDKMAHDSYSGGDSVGLMEDTLLQLAELDEDDERRFALYDTLFNYVFTSPAIADDDAQTQLAAMIESLDELPQAYVISALTLSCHIFFCDRKLELLCHFAAKDRPLETRARALVGIMMIYNRFNRQIAAFPRLGQCLADIIATCEDDLRILYQEWVTVCNTDDLRKLFENRLLPSLIKSNLTNETRIDSQAGISTHVIKIDTSDPQNLTDPTRRRALMEFIRLLHCGVDTNYNTFKPMKRFDFFMMMGHWVLPFFPNHPLVKRASTGIKDDFHHGALLSTTLCASDMYSLCTMVSLSGIQSREHLFRSMTNQMKIDEDLDEEMQKDAMSQILGELRDIRHRVRSYMQDLYRLVNINPSHEEIENPFQGSGLYMEPFWKPMISDTAFLASSAAFFAGLEKHTETIELLRRYLKLVPGDDEALSLLGEEYAKMETWRPAAECFRRAILAGGDELKCLKQLGHCLMESRNYKAVAETMDRISELCPDDVEPHILKATALMRAHQYEEALYLYRAIELMNEDEKQTAQAARGAAWCLFRLRRYEEALDCYDRFIDNGDVRHEDLLNRGHVLWALGRTEEAADSYVSHVRLFTATTDNGKVLPLEVFDEDVQDLIATTRIHPHEVAMMRDYIESQV